MIQEIPNHVETYSCINLKVLKIQKVLFFGEKACAENPGGPSKKFLKRLDVGTRSSGNHEMKNRVNLWSLKQRNQESFKQRNFETKKLSNQEAKKPRNQETPYPSTVARDLAAPLVAWYSSQAGLCDSAAASIQDTITHIGPYRAKLWQTN